MRILWLTQRGEGCVGGVHKHHEFEQEVGRHADCKWAGEGWPDYKANEVVAETVKRVMPDADWVINNSNNYEAPKTRRYKAGIFITDLHAKPKCKIYNALELLKLMNKAKHDAIFSRYKYLHGTQYPPDLFLNGLNSEFSWVPWSVDPYKFHPLEEKKFDASFLGITGSVYPFRNRLLVELPDFCEKHGIELLIAKPPSWGLVGGDAFKRHVKSFEANPEYVVGQKYVEALGRTRVLLFGCSKYRYPLQKYFEGMASSCLVLANTPSTAEELGFQDGFNYVEISKDNWKSKLLYYFKNKGDANKIAEQGRKTVLKHHTHKVRAKQFLETLEAT